MSHFKISSCRNRKLLNTPAFWTHILVVFLPLGACLVEIQGDVVPLIHNGVEAEYGKWPWHATLFIGDGLCGGTFVDNNTILTAAHCVVNGASVRRKYNMQVYGGRKYRDATTTDTQELEVANIFVHPEYNNFNLANDIAILKLTSDIYTTNYVRPVSTWNVDSNENQTLGSQGTVIGFGLDEDDEPSDTLQEATIPVLDTQTCLAYDNETYGNFLTSQMYCAGGRDNVSACNGDSGGGMFIKISDTWFLRGLVSFSPRRLNTNETLCDSSKPTVFTDVTKYQKWIMRHTNTKSWLKDLKPCKDGTIEKDTECNAATRFEHDFFLWILVSKKSMSIWRFSLNDDPAFNGHEVLDENGLWWIDKDCVEGRLYVINRGSQYIFSAKYDGTDKKAFITEGLEPLNLAVDWISRRLYWVDYGKRSIEVTSLDNPDLRTTVMTNVDGFSRIAVDPLQGKLYRTLKERGIGWSNLDGSEPELLLETPGITDITVSIGTGELCYVNEYTSKIDCIDSRSKRIRTIVNKVYGADYLAATVEKVFWSNYARDQNMQVIEGINMEGVRQKPVLKPNATDYGSSLVPVGDVCPMFYSPCAVQNGGCPENTICLPNPRPLSGKICKSTISHIDGLPDPSTGIQSKPIKPIRRGEGKQRKWPWYVAIYSTLIKNTGYLCGGSIVDENTVITAAHCFYYNATEGYRVIRQNEVSVRVGSDYVDGITDKTQLLDVVQILLHPDYNHSGFANDIAILKLSTDIHITNSVRPTTIWNAECEHNQLVGLNGTVIGFSFEKDGEPSDKLREANLSVFNSQTCLEYDNATTGNRLTSHKYCAGGSDRNNVCNMDGGGGMYFNVNGTWHLRGIVSLNAMRPNATPLTCDGFKPMVFTDVTKYRKWILRYTNRTQWLKALEPCNDGAIRKDTECNAANRSDSGFLLAYAKKGSIFRVPMNGEPSFNISEGNWINNLDYDCVVGRLYWADTSINSIFSTKYNGTDKISFISKNLESPSHVSVDWISRRLYWFGYAKNTIEVASLDDPNLRTTVLFNAALTDSIAIDPLQGKLYRLYGSNAIVSYNLDGSEPTHLLESTRTSGLYKDIKVFMATGEVCYADVYSKIDCIEPRSKRIRTIVGNLIDKRRLAVSYEMFYWPDVNIIESISDHGVRQKPLPLSDATRHIIFITAVPNVCPVFYSPCAINNGDCPSDTLCLLNPTVASGKICKYTQNCTETLSDD